MAPTRTYDGIRLAQNILVEYTVSRGRLLIFVVEVFNDKDVLITDV
ncbi:hypothetical protein [Streptomyces sp. NPDC048191]